MDKLENIRHQGMISISTTRIGLRQASCHKHSGKDEEKHFRSLVAVLTLHKLECITVICKWNCKWPYLVMPMSRVLSHITKDRHRSTWWNTQTLFLKLKPEFYQVEFHLHTLWTLKVSQVRTFLSTRREQMSLFSFKVCSIAVIFVLETLFLFWN